MSGKYRHVCEELKRDPKTWLITGVAGFIGSHLLEKLLLLEQKVVGIDNFATGRKSNLADVKLRAGRNWSNFLFLEGSITDVSFVEGALSGVTNILHQAALGSVSRSVEAPVPSHDANVTGFLVVLDTARKLNVKNFVYASSSSVYGDSPTLPKREAETGEVLSPYAATKAFNESYAKLFSRLYGIQTVGLRYFNVFGPRQDPNGEYAAVVPRWIEARMNGEPCLIFGDGETSRDFCYVDNVVEANILASVTSEVSAKTYNVACGESLSLKQLYASIDEAAQPKNRKDPILKEFRKGDIRHSLADISAIKRELGYEPLVYAKDGLEKTVAWFAANHS